MVNPGSPAHDQYDDDSIVQILSEPQIIAVVGFSANPARPSHYVAAFLQGLGHRVIPVNPGLAGQSFLGEPVYAKLADIPFEITMIDIFRNSEAAGETVAAAVVLPTVPKIIWMQLRIFNLEAARLAEKSDCQVIMNRCPIIEHRRLLGPQS
jgi:hypothetical protein